MISVSIIIPIHNRRNLTDLCLSSLSENINKKHKKNINFDIVVVDDGSSDGSKKMIRNKYPFAHLIEGNGELWWSGCINLGANYSIINLKSDYILLWNDDIASAKNYFIELSCFLIKNHPVNYIFGSKIMFYENKNKIWSLGGQFNNWSGEKYTIRKDVRTDTINCDWQPGMGTVIPEHVISSKKLFWDQKNFPQYFGDSDYSLRCLKKGVEIKTNKNLVIYNKTKFSGINTTKGVLNTIRNLFSKRSHYEIKRNFIFFSRHGIIPVVYYGMIKKYVYFIYGNIFKK